jgi:hypothetical protein
MTEDDTYNALRRVPIDELRRLLQERNNKSLVSLDDKLLEEFYTEYGWTLDAVREELTNGQSPTII